MTVDDDDATAPAGPAATAPPPTTAPRTTPSVPAPGARVGAVAVFNGTSIPGLARVAANRLIAARFTIGNVTNAATQDHQRTAILYGRPSDLPMAQEVATALRLGDVVLRPIGRTDRAIAGSGARVVVIVGADRVPPGPSR